MSESVANALVNSGNKDAEETAKFIRMIDKFFDSLNVVNLVIGKKKRKAFQSPYMSSNDFRLQVHILWLLNVFCKLCHCFSTMNL